MRLVEIIDVEKVLAEIVPFNTRVSDALLEDPLQRARGREVLVVDDSPTGVNQVRDTLGAARPAAACGNRRTESPAHAAGLGRCGEDLNERLLMVITDAEMPEMDGYRLTTEIRKDPRLKDLYVVLHTSLSGNFNKAMVEKVGCDGFLSKFQPDQLVEVVRNRLQRLES
ncbi:response regulator [Halopseudomonas pachastrellae]|nr:response regulator [Halopseudomonas pachastrellae]